MEHSSFRSDCLRGHTILITGGAGAIGRVVTQALAHHGARVAVNDIHPQEEGERIIGRDKSISYFSADITNEKDVAQLFDAVEEALDVPTVVCCHAGVVESSAYTDLSVRNFERTLDVNLKGAFLVSREAARRMKGIASALKPGRIIFTTSWVQDVPWPEIAAYCASKSAVKMLMRALAREVARGHIRVNAVAPGIVDTGMAKRQWDEDARYRARAQRAVPMGFLQSAQSVADAFLFLSSEASSYMTGATLLIDGGCSLYPMDE